MLEELKQQVYAANMELPRRGLVTYTWGNVSGIDRKAGLVVMKLVYTRGRNMKPLLVFYDSPVHTEGGRAVLANSITLTPGTVTVDIQEDGTYSVHALTEGAKAGLLDGTMQGKVARLFGETIDFRVLDVEEAEENRKTARLIETTFTAKKGLKRI